MRTLLMLVMLLFVVAPIYGAMQKGTIPYSSTVATFLMFQEDKQIVIDTEGDFEIVHWWLDTDKFCSLKDNKDLHIYVVCVHNKEIYYDTDPLMHYYYYWGMASRIDERRVAPVVTTSFDFSKKGVLIEWTHDEDMKHLKYFVYRSNDTCYDKIGNVPASSGKMEYLDKKFKASSCYIVVPVKDNKHGADIYGPRSNISCISDDPLPVTKYEYKVNIVTKWCLIKR